MIPSSVPVESLGSLLHCKDREDSVEVLHKTRLYRLAEHAVSSYD